MKWVLIFSTILVFNATAYFMRKRLSRQELYTTVLFGISAALLTDVYASFRFKAWGFFEAGVVEFNALWILFGIYPSAAAMIVNWYPYRSGLSKKFLYLAAWSVFSTGYEWITVKTEIIWHQNWNLYYSLLLYPVIYYLLIVHIRLYRRLQPGIQ